MKKYLENKSMVVILIISSLILPEPVSGIILWIYLIVLAIIWLGNFIKK